MLFIRRAVLYGDMIHLLPIEKLVTYKYQLILSLISLL